MYADDSGCEMGETKMQVLVSNNTRHVVLPVCSIEISEAGEPNYDTAELSGTCFLIGGKGYALTAAHVVEQIGRRGRVFFPDGNEWDACTIVEAERHPTEDVAILRIDLPEPVVSPIIYAQHEPFPGGEYNMWAYPEVIAKEVEHHGPYRGGLRFNPAPIYFRGYIRRKMQYSPHPGLGMYVGDNFYEVSEIGGSCCSGAPLTTISELPGVFAIYIGEAQAERRCGYATNLMKVLDWVPEILGKAIRYEVIGPPTGTVHSYE
jgi:hypothetical protein